MNVLDIAQNSVAANASIIEIMLDINPLQKLITLIIKDNGKGMSGETLAKVTDPFCTSRKTRKVGLGLPFLKMAAEMTGGVLYITSELGKGTVVKATFGLGHIDLAPIGDMTGTITTLVQCNPSIDFVYTVKADNGEFVCDTREMREILGEVSFAEPAVALWLKDYLFENTNHILKRSSAL